MTIAVSFRAIATSLKPIAARAFASAATPAPLKPTVTKRAPIAYSDQVNAGPWIISIISGKDTAVSAPASSEPASSEPASSPPTL